MLRINEQQRGFQTAQRNNLLTVAQGQGLPFLDVFQKGGDGGRIVRFKMPGRELPALFVQLQGNVIQQQPGGNLWLFYRGRIKAAEIDTQRGVRFRPGATGERHDQTTVFTGIACEAKILVIAGYLPVGEGLLGRCSPHLRREEHTKQVKQKDAVAHE